MVPAKIVLLISSAAAKANAIVVTIPFNWIYKVGNKVGDKVGNKVGDKEIVLNETRQTIIAEMRNNPNVTRSSVPVKAESSLSFI